MDLNSAPTGNTCFILTEIYESKAGVLDHFEQTKTSWGDFPPWASGWRSAKSRFRPQLPSLTRSGERSGSVETRAIHST